MSTSTDVIFAEEATSDGTSELHLSEAEAAAIKGFGQGGDSAAGISDDQIADDIQAFIDNKFGGASVDKTDPTGMTPVKASKPGKSAKTVRPAMADKPGRPQRSVPKVGVAAIRDEARANQAAAQGRTSDEGSDSTVLLKDQKPSEPGHPFQIPATSEMDPRLDEFAEEARAWMFQDEDESRKASTDHDLSSDDIAVAVATEYRHLTAGERRKLYKSKMRELNRRKVQSRKQREQAGRKGSGMLQELRYRFGAFKARFSRPI